MSRKSSPEEDVFRLFAEPEADQTDPNLSEYFGDISPIGNIGGRNIFSPHTSPAQGIGRPTTSSPHRSSWESGRDPSLSGSGIQGQSSNIGLGRGRPLSRGRTFSSSTPIQSTSAGISGQSPGTGAQRQQWTTFGSSSDSSPEADTGGTTQSFSSSGVQGLGRGRGSGRGRASVSQQQQWTRFSSSSSSSADADPGGMTQSQTSRVPPIPPRPSQARTLRPRPSQAPPPPPRPTHATGAGRSQDQSITPRPVQSAPTTTAPVPNVPPPRLSYASVVAGAQALPLPARPSLFAGRLPPPLPQSGPVGPGGVRRRIRGLAPTSQLLRGLDASDYNVLNNYKLEEIIGKGSYGSVVKGVDKTSGETVAIKVMKIGVASANIRVIEIEKEIIELFMQFDHPNILRFLNVDHVLSNRAFFISEYTQIGDLFHYLQEVNGRGVKVWKPMREHEARHIIEGIAKGLLHMHEMGVAHGDLKLHNVLLFESKGKPKVGEKYRYDRLTPKLADFGNSRQEGKGDPDGKILARCPMCTITYAAPESYYMTGQSYDMIAADYFSLGSCLLGLLLGARPYDPPIDVPDPKHPEHKQIVEKYRKLMIQLKRDISYTKNLCQSFNRELRHTLVRLLDPNPDNRMTIEEFLSSEWISGRRGREFEDSYKPRPYDNFSQPYSRDI